MTPAGLSTYTHLCAVASEHGLDPELLVTVNRREGDTCRNLAELRLTEPVRVTGSNTRQRRLLVRVPVEVSTPAGLEKAATVALQQLASVS